MGNYNNALGLHGFSEAYKNTFLRIKSFKKL